MRLAPLIVLVSAAAALLPSCASHVGVYIGDGAFVHAPSSGKTVRTDRLDDDYWKKHYVGAGRFDFRPAPPARVPQRGPTLVAGRKSS